jgi:hypothetical protein
MRPDGTSLGTTSSSSTCVTRSSKTAEIDVHALDLGLPLDQLKKRADRLASA